MFGFGFGFKIMRVKCTEHRCKNNSRYDTARMDGYCKLTTLEIWPDVEAGHSICVCGT